MLSLILRTKNYMLQTIQWKDIFSRVTITKLTQIKSTVFHCSVK